MLVVGPVKNLMQLLPVPARRAAHRPLRRPQPGLVRGRRRRGRRARRRAPLADHPLPDHRRAGRAAHRLAAPGAALGARGTGSAPSTSLPRCCTACSASASCRSGRRRGRRRLSTARPAWISTPSARPRPNACGGSCSTAPPSPPRRGAARPVEIARLDWSWLRFAPLTFSSLAGVGAVGGAVFNLLVEAGVDPRDIGVVDDAAARRRDGTALGRGRAGRRGAARRRRRRIGRAVRRALVRLPAHPRAGRHRCGCGTACSPRGRCRCRTSGCAGAEVERAAAAAGRSRRAGPGSVDRPAGGRERRARSARRRVREAHRVAAAALRADPAEVTRAALRPPPARRAPPAAHPRRAAGRGARGRRPGSSTWWAGPGRVAGAAPGRRVWLAVDRYRGLGHALTARHLVTRHRRPAPAHRRPAARRA